MTTTTTTTTTPRLKFALEFFIVLMLAWFILRFCVSAKSRSRRNNKAGDDEKREADGVSSKQTLRSLGSLSPDAVSSPSEPRLPISQGSACCPHIFGLVERARREKR